MLLGQTAGHEHTTPPPSSHDKFSTALPQQHQDLHQHEREPGDKSARAGLDDQRAANDVECGRAADPLQSQPCGDGWDTPATSWKAYTRNGVMPRHGSGRNRLGQLRNRLQAVDMLKLKFKAMALS